MMTQPSYVYILTNKTNSALYVGVTNNLTKRMQQHKTGYFKNSFTSKYQVTKLVYYEEFLSIRDAIRREKQLKGGSRQRKIELINHRNPEWRDLMDKTLR